MALDSELKRRLILLAEKYETTSFLEKDPAKFMHKYKNIRDIETVAFLSASIAFGKREQILCHIEKILAATGKYPSKWVQNQGYKDFFTEGKKSFYRVYSHNDFIAFFDVIRMMLNSSDTIGNFIHKQYKEGYLHETICSIFRGKTALIPSGKGTAAKKVNMLMRWMVRDSSPVDLGLWQWYPKSKLIIPLDTHVIQEATTLGLLSLTSKSGKIQTGSLKAALEITEAAKEIFPDDPAKLDFALFGLGIDRQINLDRKQ